MSVRKDSILPAEWPETKTVGQNCGEKIILAPPTATRALSYYTLTRKKCTTQTQDKAPSKRELLSVRIYSADAFKMHHCFKQKQTGRLQSALSHLVLADANSEQLLFQ